MPILVTRLWRVWVDSFVAWAACISQANILTAQGWVNDKAVSPTYITTVLAYSACCQCPDLPPSFCNKRTPSITMPLSIPLHIS